MFTLFLVSLMVLVLATVVFGVYIAAEWAWAHLGADPVSFEDFFAAVTHPTDFIRAWKTRAK
jgi:hypothetical protein